MNNENNNASEKQVEFNEVVDQVKSEVKKHHRWPIIDRLISAAVKLCVVMAVVLSVAAIVNKTGQQPWNPNEVINDPVKPGWVHQQVQKVMGYNTQVVDNGVITWAMHRTLLTNEVDRVYLMIPYIGWIRVGDEKSLIKG